MEITMILRIVGFALIGLGLVGAANIAGLVAREGLGCDKHPLNGTARAYGLVLPLLFAIAGFCLGAK